MKREQRKYEKGARVKNAREQAAESENVKEAGNKDPSPQQSLFCEAFLTILQLKPQNYEQYTIDITSPFVSFTSKSTIVQ